MSKYGEVDREDVDPQTHLSGHEYDGPEPRPRVGGTPTPGPDQLRGQARDGGGQAAVGDLPLDPAAVRGEAHHREAWDEDTDPDADRG